MNEIDLLSRARQGDRHAFEEVLRPVIQPAFRPDLGTARPWFLAIVANECRMARRQRWWSVLRFAEPVEREAGERDLASGIDLRNQIKRLAYDDQLLLHLYYALDLPEIGRAHV